MTYSTTPHFLAHICLIALLGSLAACQDPVDDAPPVEQDERSPKGGKGDIIGDDDRRDEFSEDVTDALREYARSTAVIMTETDLIDLGDGTTSITGSSLGEVYSMCPDETFSEQLAPGFCSAWLIAPDIMMTNGHCLTSQSACQNSAFVFDYALSAEDSALDVVNTEQVVACEKVLYWDNSSHCDVDFAVVKLARPVEGRTPVTVRDPEAKFKSEDLVIIGHPMGLPRKYALDGQVVNSGSNGFLTTHDIFGGNSGSAMFDAKTGEVQGLVTCGASNMDWEYYDQGWALQTKTGKSCDLSCDDEGLYTDGSWEDVLCAENDGLRRRCVCDGQQLVWEVRECLSFEDDTQGTCARAGVSVSEDDCKTSPWLCATPFTQHTSNFYRHVGSWQTFEAIAQDHPDGLVIEANETLTIPLVIDQEGVIASASMLLDFTGVEGFHNADEWSLKSQVAITLKTPDGTLIPLISNDGLSALDTTETSQGANPHNEIYGLDLPLEILELVGTSLAGEYTLELTNTHFDSLGLYSASLNTRVVPENTEITFPGPCDASFQDCEAHYVNWPEPLHEPFDSDPMNYDQDGVVGTLGAGLEVQALDPEGEGYEVFKTRSSQTMSLSTGEIGILKTFTEDIGGRDLTLDYRYDGEGWFQVWADDQILFTDSAFSQQQITVNIPTFAKSLRFVLGAVDGTRVHEVTLFDLVLSAPTVQDDGGESPLE